MSQSQISYPSHPLLPPTIQITTKVRNFHSQVLTVLSLFRTLDWPLSSFHRPTSAIAAHFVLISSVPIHNLISISPHLARSSIGTELFLAETSGNTSHKQQTANRHQELPYIVILVCVKYLGKLSDSVPTIPFKCNILYFKPPCTFAL